MAAPVLAATQGSECLVLIVFALVLVMLFLSDTPQEDDEKKASSGTQTGRGAD